MLNKVLFALINEGFVFKCPNIYFVAYIQFYIKAVGFVFFRRLFLLTILFCSALLMSEKLIYFLTVGVNFIFLLLRQMAVALTRLSGL
jgi:hypothetical protein